MTDPASSDALSEGPTDPDGLSAQDLAILAMEERSFRYVGAKERRIREELGLSPTSYFVRLNALLDRPEALRAAPGAVNRLRARRVSSTSTGPGPAHAA
ncbi:DUF3263 domain-containing protein [Brachybacterium endophyticum]|uniref:DUF3263 domain-containing protein n=1 Tax=Brachybacterium endophyticum TaxID=2182385 RepID=A0A2U2RP39_9MICO|nr:DUF3263 domain-containing protein [Brachybacterium endophyticum]PWH07629.1 DUF3263 domain-containing protein [Brachybacterium endophyticum]